VLPPVGSGANSRVVGVGGFQPVAPVSVPPRIAVLLSFDASST